MSTANHKYPSSVVRPMLANQKVRGSILHEAGLGFCCHVRIYTGFYTEITRENTSSKHERYTRNGANRISSLARNYYTCFRFFELVLHVGNTGYCLLGCYTFYCILIIINILNRMLWTFFILNTVVQPKMRYHGNQFFQKFEF